MRPDGATGTLELDVNAIDGLDDEAFRRVVEQHLDTDPSSKPVWKALCHPTLVERTEGCLDEMAEELQAAVAGRALRDNHFKAKRLAVVNTRMRQVDAAMSRVDDLVRVDKEEALKTLVRQLALAVNEHRVECVNLGLTPEPHDLALWETLDSLALPDSGPTLAEQITAGRWYLAAVIPDGT